MTITVIWAIIVYKIYSTLYLSSTLPHSVIIQGPVHNVLSHYSSIKPASLPGHHRGCARDCC